MSAHILTDAEKAAIIEEIKTMYETMAKDWINNHKEFDYDAFYETWQDTFGLGTIFNGFFHTDLDKLKKDMRENITSRKHMELKEMGETRVAVLAPDIAVLISPFKAFMRAKDDSTFSGEYVNTMIYKYIDDQWIGVHMHQSWHPAEE